MVDELYAKRLEKKIQAPQVVTALLRAGAFLTGYELVKASIVDGVKDFFLVGFDEDGMTYSSDYKNKVLPLGKNAWDASVRWLVSVEALTEEQASSLDDIYAHRHEIAHELAKFLVDPDAEVSLEKLQQLYGIMRSLDRFWGGINVDTNPDFDGVEVDYDNIKSGSGLLLEYLLQIASGDPAAEVDKE